MTRADATVTVAPLFVVSPHLDDAVFGCGAWLAAEPGATVCTVCCAIPPVAIGTQWDSSAGFRDSTSAMHARFREDDQALAVLQASALRLPFFDHQYGQRASPRDIAEAIADALQQRSGCRFVMPLGLVHPDHVLVSDACLLAMQTLGIAAWSVYEEAPYRAMPGVVDARVAELTVRHPQLQFTRIEAPGEPITARETARCAQLKRDAIRAYASQLPALAHLPIADLEARERVWTVTRCPERT